MFKGLPLPESRSYGRLFTILHLGLRIQSNGFFFASGGRVFKLQKILMFSLNFMIEVAN